MIVARCPYAVQRLCLKVSFGDIHNEQNWKIALLVTMTGEISAFCSETGQIDEQVQLAIFNWSPLPQAIRRKQIST